MYWHCSSFIVKFGVDGTDEEKMMTYITGGPLPEGKKFRLAKFHLHWGNETHGGSEHTVDDYRLRCTNFNYPE